MTTLEAFTVFPNLPSELRLKIWDLVIRSPRTASMRCKKGQVDKTIRASKRFAVSFSSTTPPPAALHVCQESRYEALAVYSKHFETEHAPNYTYLNMSQDSIRCQDNIMEYFGPVLQECGVERLLLDVADAGYFGHFNIEHIGKMEQLKNLTLYIIPGAVSSWDSEGRDVATILRDFDRHKAYNPGWECPLVHVVHQNTGAEIKTIESGASIPGWVQGDPNPFLD